MNGLEWITEESKWLEKREYIDEWINLIVSDKISLVKIPKDQKEYYCSNVDCFTWQDISQPVMKGIDTSQRPFMTIKVIIDNKHKFMQTFYQRYTSEKYNWIGCISSIVSDGTKAIPSRNDFLYTGGGMNKEQFKLLSKLINNYLEGNCESLIINFEHKTNKHFIGKKVRIYDEEKENAYNLICRTWIKSRFDPSYKMCRKIQEYKYDAICIN
jgi:hypothetical protein